MHSRDVNASFANALVDEWARGGLGRVVIAPGSRSTPLALAFARDQRMAVHVLIDERSAAFFALGLAKATGDAVAVVCTSGTAAANFHPAVVEAHHARVPLLVCTADRPPELRDIGAPQTIDQADLFGTSARWFHDPGPPDDEPGAGARWRTLASRALAHARGAPPGPVHLNLPFREPLVPTGEPLVDAPGRDDGAPFVATVRASADVREAARALTARIETVTNGVIVAGFGADTAPRAVASVAAATGWPVLADAISNVRCGGAVSTYEALLRSDRFVDRLAPALAVRVGAPLTSKVANAWLDRIPTVVVDEYDGWRDPSRTAVDRIVAAPTRLFDTAAELLGGERATEPHGWTRADKAARVAIDGALDADDLACEARVARDVAATAPAGAQLVVASSLAVRALEWAMAPRDGVTVHANRGANGIDGFVSTALGVAAGTGAPTVALLGDLCFLHDVNGLLAGDGLDATLVVVDNCGGGIFEYLPQHDLDEFEPLFATPQSVDLVAVARALGANAVRVDGAVEFGRALADAMDRKGLQVVVVSVDRAAARARHQSLWRAVDEALGSIDIG